MGKSQTEKLKEAVAKQGSKIVGDPGKKKDIPEVTEEKEEKILSPIYQQAMGIDNIIPNPESQEIYGDDPVDDLIESIEDSGLLIPVLAILVEPEKAMLVSGYRRWKAFGILRDRFKEENPDTEENPYEAIPIDWWHGDRENEVEVLKAVLETNVSRDKSEYQRLKEAEAWKKIFEKEAKARKTATYFGKRMDEIREPTGEEEVQEEKPDTVTPKLMEPENKGLAGDEEQNVPDSEGKETSTEETKPPEPPKKPRKALEALEQVAKQVGWSGNTLKSRIKKLEEIEEKAETDTEAKKALGRIQKDGAKINEEYKKLFPKMPPPAKKKRKPEKPTCPVCDQKLGKEAKEMFKDITKKTAKYWLDLLITGMPTHGFEPIITAVGSWVGARISGPVFNLVRAAKSPKELVGYLRKIADTIEEKEAERVKGSKKK